MKSFNLGKKPAHTLFLCYLFEFFRVKVLPINSMDDGGTWTLLKKKLLLNFYLFCLGSFHFPWLLPPFSNWNHRQAKSLLGNFLHLTWKDFWQVRNCMHTRKFSTLRFARDLFHSIKNFSVSLRETLFQCVKKIDKKIEVFSQNIKEIPWKFGSFFPNHQRNLMKVWEFFTKALSNLMKVWELFTKAIWNLMKVWELFTKALWNLMIVWELFHKKHDEFWSKFWELFNA